MKKLLMLGLLVLQAFSWGAESDARRLYRGPLPDGAYWYRPGFLDNGLLENCTTDVRELFQRGDSFHSIEVYWTRGWERWVVFVNRSTSEGTAQDFIEVSWTLDYSRKRTYSCSHPKKVDGGRIPKLPLEVTSPIPIGAVRLDTIPLDYVRQCYSSIREALARSDGFESFLSHQPLTLASPIPTYFLNFTRSSPAPTAVTLESGLEDVGEIYRYRCGRIRESSLTSVSGDRYRN